MSSVLHPVGPESSGTYWVRRVGVLAAVILVVVVVIWAIPNPTRTAEPAGPASGTTTATATTKASGGSSSATTASATPASPTPTTPAPIVDCVDAVTKVTTAGPTRVSADKKATFKVTVTNTGQVTCTLAINPDTFELRVISGSDKIWTTSHCAKWLPTVKSTKVKPGKAISVTITWPGQRSRPDCTQVGGLKAGTYVAKAIYGDAAPGNLILSLR